MTKQKGKPFLTVEDVLRARTTKGDGTTSERLKFRDVVFGNGLAGPSMLFHWQVLPRHTCCRGMSQCAQSVTLSVCVTCMQARSLEAASGDAALCLQLL